jgi:hypothetical protein
MERECNGTGPGYRFGEAREGNVDEGRVLICANNKLMI